MDYIAFCKDYYAATCIPINLVEGKNALYSTAATMLNMPGNDIYSSPLELECCPQFSHMNPEIEYGIIQIKEHNLAVVIGPFFQVDITSSVVNTYLRENLIPLSEKERVFEFLCTIPKLSHLQIAKHMIFIHQALNNEAIPLSHFFSREEVSESDNTIADNDLDRIDSHEYYNTYTNELRLYEIIKNGNETELKDYLDEVPMNLLSKPLAKSPLRQAKNMFINTITNVVMIGAIPGGVSMNEAYDLMGKYVLDCENMQSGNEIETLRYNMLFEFCRLSGRNKVPQGISSDIFVCMSYIRSHTNEPISVEDVAAYIDRSASYITKGFQRELGISPGAFITRCKLEEAKSMLIYSEKSLAEISNYLCYSSQGYFQNSFKKKFGETPLSYRNRMRRVE